MAQLLPNGLPPAPVTGRKRIMSDGSVGLDTLMDDISTSKAQLKPGPWEHEDASSMLIDYTHDQLGEQADQIGLTKKDIQLIQEFVKGDSERYERINKQKVFLFDLVSNKRNSFDLDKLDYLNRDLIHTQINQSQINYNRIISNACIIDGKIAYNKKIYNEINMVYERRFELFK